MDIPELVRQLLILKSQLKPKVKMSIHIDTETLSVRMWIGRRQTWQFTMELSKWATASQSLIDKCLIETEKYDLVTKQQTLDLWQ